MPVKLIFFNSLNVSSLCVVGAATINSSASLTQVFKSGAIFMPDFVAWS